MHRRTLFECVDLIKNSFRHCDTVVAPSNWCNAADYGGKTIIDWSLQSVGEQPTWKEHEIAVIPYKLNLELKTNLGQGCHLIELTRNNARYQSICFLFNICLHYSYGISSYIVPLSWSIWLNDSQNCSQVGLLSRAYPATTRMGMCPRYIYRNKTWTCNWIWKLGRTHRMRRRVNVCGGFHASHGEKEGEAERERER